MCGQRETLFLIAIAMLVIAAVASTANAQSALTVTFPLFGEPEAVVPGNLLNITLTGVSDPSSLQVSISSGNTTYALNYTYEVSGGSLVLHALVGNFTPGLYDLIVSSGNETTISQRSVVVYSEWPKELVIAHFTDVHIGVVNSYPKTEDALDLYTNAILLAPMLGANLIIETGDIADTGGIASQYADFVKITQLSTLPTIILPGNHDYSGDSSLNNWHKYIGPNYFYLRWGPYLIIALDSGATGTVPLDQLNWAEQVLKNNTDASVKILAFHHPIFRTDLYGKINGSYTNIASLQQYFYSSWASDLTAASKVLELVEKYNISLVLAGHVHSDGAVLYNGKTWFITTTALGGPVGPIATASYHGHADYHGFRLIAVFANGTVSVIPRADNPDVFSGPTSIPVENIFSKFVTTDKTLAWIFQADGVKELQVISPGNQLNLSIHVLSSMIPSGAKLLALGNVSEASMSCGQYSCIIHVTMPKSANDLVRILLTSVANDTTPPSVGTPLVFPQKPVAGRDSIQISIQASDPEWGVAKVMLIAKFPNGTTMEYLMRDVGQGYYQATIPPANVPYIQFDVVAENSGGLSSDVGWTNLSLTVPTTTQPVTTTTSPPTTSTATQTTTTTTSVMTTTTTTAATTTTQTAATTTTTSAVTTASQTVPASTTPAQTSTAAQGGGISSAVIAVVIVVVIVAIAAVFLFKR